MAYDCHKCFLYHSASHSLYLSLSYTHTCIRLIVLSYHTFSPSLALVPSFFRKSWQLKPLGGYRAIRSCVVKVCRTHFLWRDILTFLFLSRLVITLVLPIVLRYIYIYLFIYFICISSKGHECVQYKIANVLSKLARTKIVRYSFTSSKQAMPSFESLTFINPE